MTLFGWAELALGSAITAVTLLDVFATIFVPGPNRQMFSAAIWFRYISLPLFRLRAARTDASPGSRPANSFAPFMFVVVAATWMLLLMLGYGLMFHALAADFAPRLDRFGQAFYVAGSSLATLGVSEVDAQGGARWLILASAFSGFGVITAAITFILQIQTGLQHREPRVLTMAGLAGSPPSGVALLGTIAALEIRGELPQLFAEWRDWSAAVTHSHVTFPVLAYFHSVDAETDWLAALEAMLDAATMLMALIEDEACGPATLMHRTGARAVAKLADMFRLPANPADAPGPDELATLVERLAHAGYRVRTEPAALNHFVALRRDYSGRITALSEHLGAERARLVPTH